MRFGLLQMANARGAACRCRITGTLTMLFPTRCRERPTYMKCKLFVLIATEKRDQTMQLRSHQKETHDIAREMVRNHSLQPKTRVVSAFPGSGKSSLPVIVASELIPNKLVDKVAIVVPRLSLKRQGALAFEDLFFRDLLKHNLQIREAGNDHDPSRGTAGFITTYQAIQADSANIIAQEIRRFRYATVFDEIHHAAFDSKLHRALQPIWDEAAFRILMTGTMDRNEGDRIAFLEYEKDINGRWKPQSDIHYPLRSAIAEKAIIPIEFVLQDACGSFLNASGDRVDFKNLQISNRDELKDAIWAALSTEYADYLLESCFNHWKRWHSIYPRSRMLAVCASVSQAREVLRKLRKMGANCDIAVSEDEESQGIIKKFRESKDIDVLVTVQMAYEGLDVPPLTHLVCLTHIRSHPWLMQMFGRIMRFDRHAGPWENQKAFAFVPDDSLMEEVINYIREQQVLGIADREKRTCGPGSGGPRNSIPLASEKTRERASGIDQEHDIDYEETAHVQHLMDEFNIHGSCVDVARMLRAHQKKETSNVDPDSSQSSFQEKVHVTVADEMEALKKKIQKTLNWIDWKRGLPPGTMNERAFNEAQNYKKRGDLTPDELRKLWQWVQKQRQLIANQE